MASPVRAPRPLDLPGFGGQLKPDVGEGILPLEIVHVTDGHSAATCLKSFPWFPREESLECDATVWCM